MEGNSADSLVQPLLPKLKGLNFNITFWIYLNQCSYGQATAWQLHHPATSTTALSYSIISYRVIHEYNHPKRGIMPFGEIPSPRENDVCKILSPLPFLFFLKELSQVQKQTIKQTKHNKPQANIQKGKKK